METLQFTTPVETHRPTQNIPVDLCGMEFTVPRPKDSVRLLASTATAATVSNADKAAAILEFMQAAPSEMDYQRWKSAIADRDDPIDTAETAALIEGLTARWDAYDADSADEPDESPLVIEQQDSGREPMATRVVSQDRADGVDESDIGLFVPADLDMDVWFHRPKEMAGWIVYAALSNPDDVGQMVWSLGFFGEASLSAEDDAWLSRRLLSNDPDDLLDLLPLADIANALMDGWSKRIEGNRQQRRAAKSQAKKRPGNPGGNKSRGKNTASSGGSSSGSSSR